jgi:hypothetical protein
MKRIYVFFTALFFLASITPGISQKILYNSAVTGVCYAGNKTNRIFIPPPDAFFRKTGSKGGASITVIESNLPQQVKVAVDYAASILESILPADTKFTLSVSWEKMTSNGVLANSSIGGYEKGRNIDALNPLALYPLALAEKISGKNLNDSLESDVSLTINSSIDNWYYGTDGNTPSQKYDLTTVVLHELCHGIGFFDSMTTNSTTGSFGYQGYPMIYDTFIENAAGVNLTDTLAIPNNSAALRRELTGGNLYIDGPLLSYFTSGARPQIYAPSTWDAGSSISHLDEYATSEPNTLMTPFIDMGEAIHNPGKLTMSILGDVGWVNTRIIHKAGHDTEQHLNQLLLSVTIVSDTLYDHNNVGAVISYNDFISSDTILMASSGPDGNFSCLVGIPSYNTELQYYFFAKDCFQRIYRSPSLFDTLRYSVYVGADTVKPVLSHTPVTSLLEKIDTIRFIATATDNLGIDTVYAEYQLNDGQLSVIGLKADKDNIYIAELNAASLFLQGGDSIRYRIFAADSATLPNSAFLPDAGYYTIHIEGLNSVLVSYSTDFTGDATEDFINKGFEVANPSGFSGYGLNSKHPYESPEDNNKTIEYTSILRHPLKFKGSGMVVSFNEVVLVEPGETGSVFGSADFYDYVIVEGSENFGKTWFGLTDGYDSRYYKPWETAYNKSIVGYNSTTVGKESMLNSHTIFYKSSGNISDGDTLLVRFRLFSDPYANGWGWIIENLKINPLIDDVENVQPDIPVIIYPNPGGGVIRMSYEHGSENMKPVRYSIFNTSGTCIKSDYLTGEIENIIDISDRPAGIYIIVLKGKSWIKTIKYSLIK